MEKLKRGTDVEPGKVQEKDQKWDRIGSQKKTICLCDADRDCCVKY